MANAPLTPLENVLSNAPSFDLPASTSSPAGRRMPAAKVNTTFSHADLAPPPELRGLFEDAAARYDVPVNVLMAIAQQESTYNPKAIGVQTEWGQAKGLMQYLDSTAQGMGIDPYDPAQSIEAASKQLRERLDKGYGMDEAVMEHFAGPDRAKWGEKTARYGQEVLAKAGALAQLYAGEEPAAAPVPAGTTDTQGADLLAAGAPSPLTIENQARALEQNGIVPSKAAPKATPGTDGFLKATGKTLDNLPERFQNMAGGLVQAFGENVDDQTLVSHAAEAGIIEQMQKSGDIVMQPSGLLGKPAPYLKNGEKAGTAEVAAYIRQNADTLMTTEQAGAMLGMTPSQMSAYGKAISDDAHSTMVKVNPNGPVAKYGSMIIGSTLEMAPAIAAAMVTKSPGVAMSIMGAQVGGDSYDKARRKGMNPDQALGYATAQAAAEVIGEGVPLKYILRQGGNLFGNTLKAGVAEMVQEGVTGAIQTGIDKGTIDPDMTWGEARQQIIDNMIVGFGSGTLLRGGVDATRAGVNALRRNPAEQPQPAVPGTDSGTAPSAERTDPAMGEIQTEAATDPALGELPVVPNMDPELSQPAQPAQPAGPMARALQNAPAPVLPTVEETQIVEPTQPAAALNPFAGEPGTVLNLTPPDMDPITATIEGYADGDVVLRDTDGNLLQLSPEDLQGIAAAPGAPGAPEAVPVAQPGPAIEQPAPAVPAAPVAQVEPSKSYKQMDEAELRDRLKYIRTQAKVNGWNTTLKKERDRVERAIDDLSFVQATPAPVADTVPAVPADTAAPIQLEAQPEAADAEPVKWFGTQEKADAFIAKKKLGDSHQVVPAGRSRFEVRPLAPSVSIGETEAADQQQPPPTKAALPRQQVGPDASSYTNSNAQISRDRADRAGVTSLIEGKFAEGKTARQVRDELNDKLAFVDEEERDSFVIQVRATLGIPSQADAEGKAEFAAWKEARSKRDTAADPAPIEGKSIDGDWTAFAPESGTLSIPRAKMPQVKAEHRGALVNFLSARGIAHQEETVPAASLKATQAEFSRAKVEKAKGYKGGDRSILVARSGHVVDGHHQWMAKLEKGEDVKVIRLDAPIRDLLRQVSKFPSSATDEGAAAVPPVPADTQAPKAEPAQPPVVPAAPVAESTQPRRGEVGGKLAAGEVVTTSSGRQTTPFPRLDFDSERKSGNTVKRVDQWLMDNAIEEARARGDDFNLPAFEASRDKPSPADKDGAEEYLFGDQPPVLPKALKPLVAPKAEVVPVVPADTQAPAAPPKSVAPGTRINTPADRAAADRLESVLESVQGSRSTPEGGARIAIRSVIEELRKPRTVVSVQALLETAAQRLNKNYGAQADVVYEVAEQLGQPNQAAETVDTVPAVTPDTPKAEPTKNVLVSDERAAELRKRLQAKLAQLNSGIDPEILAIGTELAVYHVERGVRTFAAFAKTMAGDLGTTVEKIRPYLRSWYNGARDMTEDMGGDVAGMDSPDTVRAELAKLDAQETTNEPTELGQPGQGPLEGAPAESRPGAAQSGETGRGAASGRADDAPGNERAGSGRSDEQRGMGNDQGEVPVPASGSDGGRAAGKRGQPSVQRGDGDRAGAGRDDSDRVTPAQGTTAQDRAQDFAITADDAIGQGGKKTKFKQNVAAIRLLKELDGKTATREQQAVLAKYVGWGGIPEAFERSDSSASKGWDKEVAELRELLTPQEYSAAASSTRNAHYTSPEVVSAMWTALEHLGFKGGRLLEPSVGIGNFFGLMPKALRSGTALHGVELDTLTGALVKQLYPKAKVAVMGFQDYTIPDGYFDAAIGNPPFGRESLYDGTRKDLSGFSIHNYFFAKTVDGLKPGGVMAMVVTNRMLDVAGDKARTYIAQRADLLGAIRLPNDAFAKNAGTEVTTDIIFLRKRLPDEKPNGETWSRVVDYTDADGKTVPLNEYFMRHPEMMLGDFGAYGSMYSPEDPALVAKPGQDTPALLAAAIARLPAGVMAPVGAEVKPETPATIKADHVRVGSMFIQDGQVLVREPDELGENRATAVPMASDKARDRVVGMIGIRDALASVRGAQLDASATTKLIEGARKKLNEAYDAFVKEHGPLNLDANKRLFRDDPSWPQLSALEDGFDKGISAAIAKKTGEEARKPSATKAAIFTKRTQSPYKAPESASSAKDALVASLAETGRIDAGLMSRLYGKPADDIMRELGDLVFQDPAKGWVTRDAYLSGNVKAKLAEARQAAQNDSAYQRNVAALEAVQPADVEAVDINVKPGAAWLPEAVMSDFADYIGEGSGARAFINPINAKWGFKHLSASAAARQRWETGRVGLGHILEAAANQKALQVFDNHADGTRTLNETETQLANDKVSALKDEWGRWIWSDDGRRERLARLYNDIFNTNVARNYDGAHMNFPGKVGDDVISVRPHQKNFAWRVIQSETTLGDHVVGAGKTFAAILAAMELRRMGLAKKPMFVVPNSLVGQWAADFTKLYPGANVLAATKKDFEKDNRKRLFARIATGDWDAVIVSHSSFGKVEVEPSAQAEFIEEQIQDLDASLELMRANEGKGSRNVKDVEKRRTALREKLTKLFDAENKDDSLYWGELGIDALFLDEAHEFKNLAFSTSMSRVAGLGNQAGSQKAADMFLKVKQVQKATGGRNIVFLTGTPISNTMAEMYTMQRFLDYPTLKAQGISHFDAWARMFGEVVTDWELSPSGKFKMNSRFAKFVNMPELMQRYTHFADVINRDDINRMLAEQGKKLPVPKLKGGKPENVVVERSPAQAAYIGEPIKDKDGNDTDDYPQGSLVWRSENIPKKAEKGADNMLKIMSDARKAALDMRLIYPDAGDHPGSKVNVAADRIRATYDKWHKDRGTQLVFIDLSTPKKARAKEAAALRELIEKAEKGDDAAQEKLDNMSPDEFMALEGDFSVYDDLKQKLLDRGIPEAEIAFIHDANTELQKEELFGKVRSGRVRVLFGSTAKMGAGMNVQNRLVALHHLDAPWRPSDLEQREGRIIRQGNELYTRDPEGFEVEVMRYATKQTLDSRMWQTIEGKARFIEQVRKGNTGEREIEDVGGEASNSAEMKAASSGNPLILEEMTLRQSIRKLETERQGFEREQYRLRDSIRRLERNIDWGNIKLDELRKDVKRAPSEFLMVVDGQSFDKRKDAGEAILAQAAEMDRTKTEELELGTYGDFKLSLTRTSAEHFVATLEGAGTYSAGFTIGSDPQGLSMRITNTVRDLDAEIESVTNEQARARKDIPKLEAQSGTWTKEADLTKARERHGAVLDQLKPKKRESKVEKADDEALSTEDAKFRSAGLSPNSVVRGATRNPAPLTVEQATEAAEAFLREYNGNIPLRFVVKKTQEDIYGPKGSVAKIGRVKGAYHAEGGGVFTLAADNLSDLADARETLRHEILGHYGLDTFKAADKQALLDKILASKSEPSLKQAWDHVSSLYADKSDAIQAEEVFAYLAEMDRSTALKAIDTIRAALVRMLRTVGYKRGVVTKAELLREVEVISRGIKNGTRTPPTDPNGDKPRFKRDEKGSQTDSAFKKWFGKSQVVDAEGKPLVVYHGTNADFSTFDPEKIGSATDDGHLGRGFYFSTDPRVIGKRAIGMPVYLRAENPLIVSMPDFRTDKRTLVPSDLGSHDAVILDYSPTGYNHKEIMVRSPEQIKSAIGNNGDYDASNPDIRFRRDDSAGAANDAPPADASESQIKAWLKGAAVDMKPKTLALIPLNYLVDLARPNMTAVADYLATKRKMDAYRSEAHGRYDTIAQDWRKLIKGDAKAAEELSALMHESTIAGVDPAEPFKSIINRMDRDVLAYDPTSDAAAEVRKKLAEDAERRKAHAELRARFDALPVEFKGMYRTVRDTYKAQSKELDAILIANMENAIDLTGKKADRQYAKEMERIADEGLEGQERATEEERALKRLNTSKAKQKWNKKARMTQLRQQFESNRLSGPYFPLSRFGDYFVTVRDSEGAVVSFSRFEKSRDMERFARESAEPGFTVTKGVLSNKDQIRGAVDPSFVAEIEEILGGAGVPDGVKDQVWQRYLETMPDLSLRKRNIHRKGRAGFHHDAFRGFGSHMFHAAHQMARLKFSATMDEHLEDAQFQAAQSDDPVGAAQLVNELRLRHAYVLNPKGAAWAQHVTSAAFVYFLGITPAAAIVNLSQTAILGVPILGAQYGMLNAQKELIKASKDFIVGKGTIAAGKVTPEERAALNRAYTVGLLDRTQAHDLAGVGETGVEYNAARARVMAAISWSFHHAERFNREATFIAAYRLAKQADQADAFDRAADLTWKIHFDYSNTNRPRVLHGDVAKALFVFRNYSVNMLYRLLRDIHQSMKGETKQARKEARYQLGGIMGMMALNAGAVGVPFFSLGMMLAQLLLGDDEDDFTVEDQFKKGVVDTLGTNLGGMVLNGIPGHLTGIDLSARIGMPDLWFRSPYKDMEGQEAYNYWQSQLLGAVPGIAQNAFRGVGMMADGHVYRGIETMMPKAIKDVMKTYRFGTEGALNLKGQPIVEDVSPQDLLKQVIGFTPAKISEQYDRNSALMNAQTKIRDARADLMNRFALAVRIKDDEARAEVMQDIREFSKRYPQKAITPANLRSSLRARARNADGSVGGVTLDRKLDKRLREGLSEPIY